jgi:hypothetical protein
VNATETPGGSGIPAGWYDDPSGQGLRWWDGEAWTEHVHTAESAAAAADTGEGSREGKPPRDLVKLREKIRARGVKGIGMVLGAAVVVIVVIALLLSGGSENSSGNANPGAGTPGAGKTAKASAKQAQIKKIDKQLQNKNLSKSKKKQLTAQKKKLEKSSAKAATAAKKKAKGGGKKQVSPGEEGN